MKKELSVIILTYNQRDFTLRCLDSIRSLMDDSRYEIILIDNGSTDRTEDVVKEQFPKVIYFYLKKNLGVAAGRNTGLRIASGRKLMFLDNDTIVPAGSIETLCDYLDENPDVGLVAPRLISPQGKLQKSWKEFPGIMVKLKNVLSIGKSNHYADSIPKKEIEPFYVIGAAQMFTRVAFQNCGELDEKIFYGPEDADYCMRIRKSGKRVVYNPNITIVHDWQRITTKKMFSPLGRKHLKGLLYFYWKNKRLF